MSAPWTSEPFMSTYIRRRSSPVRRGGWVDGPGGPPGPPGPTGRATRWGTRPSKRTPATSTWKYARGPSVAAPDRTMSTFELLTASGSASGTEVPAQSAKSPSIRFVGGGPITYARPAPPAPGRPARVARHGDGAGRVRAEDLEADRVAGEKSRDLHGGPHGHLGLVPGDAHGFRRQIIGKARGPPQTEGGDGPRVGGGQTEAPDPDLEELRGAGAPGRDEGARLEEDRPRGCRQEAEHPARGPPEVGRVGAAPEERGVRGLQVREGEEDLHAPRARGGPEGRHRGPPAPVQLCVRGELEEVRAPRRPVPVDLDDEVRSDPGERVTRPRVVVRIEEEEHPVEAVGVLERRGEGRGEEEEGRPVGEEGVPRDPDPGVRRRRRRVEGRHGRPVLERAVDRDRGRGHGGRHEEEGADEAPHDEPEGDERERRPPGRGREPGEGQRGAGLVAAG